MSESGYDKLYVSSKAGASVRIRIVKIFGITLLGRIWTIGLNLLTGAVLAHGTSPSDRGTIFAITSILTIMQVAEALEVNESSLRLRNTNELSFNIFSVLFLTIGLFAYIQLGLYLQNDLINLLILIAFILSLFNSRLITMVFLRNGVLRDRIFQGVATLFYTSALLLLFLNDYLDVSTWIIANLCNEFFYLLMIFVFGKIPRKAFFPRMHFKMQGVFTLTRLSAPLENLGDRILIAICILLNEPEMTAYLAISISLMNLVMIPFVATYPYPVSHAETALGIITKNLKRIALSLLVFLPFFCYINSKLLGYFIPIVFGPSYANLVPLSFLISLSGVCVGFQKIILYLLRGFNKTVYALLLQSITLTTCAITLQMNLKDIDKISVFLISWSVSSVSTLLFGLMAISKMSRSKAIE